MIYKDKFKLKILLLCALLIFNPANCISNINNNVEIIINIELENKLLNITINQEELLEYPILKFLEKNKQIKKFKSDKYYIKRLQELVISLKNLNKKPNITLENEYNLRFTFTLIFCEVIHKVIRTYRFIFNNIDCKLNDFYNKYCNNLQYYNYSSNNELVDKIYKEFRNIIM